MTSLSSCCCCCYCCFCSNDRTPERITTRGKGGKGEEGRETCSIETATSWVSSKRRNANNNNNSRIAAEDEEEEEVGLLLLFLLPLPSKLSNADLIREEAAADVAVCCGSCAAEKASPVFYSLRKRLQELEPAMN